jgi:ribosomal protein S18 acetylase RimI-like enzyme
MPAAPEQEVIAGGARYWLESVRGADLAPLVPLFRTTYHRRDFTREWLEKKYRGSFGGVEGFSCIAFTEDGKAVAACGMLPWPIRFGDRTEIAAQVVDAATHPAHRRRRLFSRLVEMAHARCEAAGVSFFFAFPHRSGDSYPGFVGALGYTHVDDLVEYRLPARTFWAQRAARRMGPLGGLYRRWVERALTRYRPADPLLPNSLLTEGSAGTDRDHAFYAYKGFAGSRVLDVDGGRVWLKFRHGIQIGDLEAQSETDMERSARALERLAVRLGVHQLVFQSSKGTRFSRFFAARWRTVPCVSFVYRNIRSGIPPDQLRFTLGDLDNF